MLTWTLITADWSIRLVMAVVILLRKRSADALAWLCVCMAFPLLGLGLYLLIGGNRLGRRRSERHARSVAAIDAASRLVPAPAPARAAIPAHRRDLAAIAEKLGEMPIVPGNSAELLPDPAEFLRRLIADIDAAASHVHLLFYIYADDDAGRDVADALIRATARGVRVRLLADAVGSRPLFRRRSSLLPRMRHAGVEVHPALPVNPIRRRLARIDLRNHRKLAVIDGSVCYTGSQNIVHPVRAPGGGSEDPAPSPGIGSSGSLARRARALLQRRRDRWEDLGVRLTGPIVQQAQVVFLEDWHFTTGHAPADIVIPPAPLTPAGAVVAQMVPSGPTYEHDVFHRFIVAALHDAQHRIELCTPYFVPDEPVLLALLIAAQRGVEVELVLPSGSDHVLVNLAARSHFDELLRAGVRIHLFQGLMLHSKSLVIDNDLALIGSGNLDMRSFYLNFELNLVLYSRRFAAALRGQHARYLADSTPLDPAAWSTRPLWRRVLERAVGLLGPLL